MTLEAKRELIELLEARFVPKAARMESDPTNAGLETWEILEAGRKRAESMTPEQEAQKKAEDRELWAWAMRIGTEAVSNLPEIVRARIRVAGLQIRDEALRNPAPETPNPEPVVATAQPETDAQRVESPKHETRVIQTRVSSSGQIEPQAFVSLYDQDGIWKGIEEREKAYRENGGDIRNAGWGI